MSRLREQCEQVCVRLWRCHVKLLRPGAECLGRVLLVMPLPGTVRLGSIWRWPMCLGSCHPHSSFGPGLVLTVSNTEVQLNQWLKSLSACLALSLLSNIYIYIIYISTNSYICMYIAVSVSGHGFYSLSVSSRMFYLFFFQM